MPSHPTPNNVCASLVGLTVLGLMMIAPRALCAQSDEDFFESKIRPLLELRCAACHSSEKGKTHGGLALDSQLGWSEGGDSGPAIVPGNVDESLLLRAIAYGDEGLQMPPEEAGGKLASSEIALLTEWVRRGAPDPRVGAAKRGGMTEEELRSWWSFQPVNERVAVPAAISPSQAANEIDPFIQARLAIDGLAMSPPADRRTLIRRASYELTGLPPSPAEVDAFLTDDSPRAFESVVDRLLMSPHYGEHWGRRWLDVVRYADTAGENSDHPIPDAWRYRNWVIDAFNEDMPYDRFVQEQIAGDLLHAQDQGNSFADGIIATGFLAIARRFEHDSDKHMHLTYEDTIGTLGPALLGLSIACARCHDHKFDPISANDYYAMYGILSSTRYSFPGCEAKQQPRDPVPLLPPDQWSKTIEPYDRQLAAIDLELKDLQSAQAAAASPFKPLAATSVTTLAYGQIADGGAENLVPDMLNPKPIAVTVRPGQWLRLVIDRAEDYGADTTVVEWDIRESGGQNRHWNLTQDVVEDFAAANPHADHLQNDATWCFLDARGNSSFLSEIVRNHSGQAGLHIWRSGDNPAVFVNANAHPVSVWTTLPAKTLFVHPAPDGPVAVAWISPMEGQIEITGRIADGHPGGPNGVTWQLEQIDTDISANALRMAKTTMLHSECVTKREMLVASAPQRDMAYAVTEGTVANARLHQRGDPEKLGEEVPRRWLDLFGGERVPEGAGSGRLQLAQWLTEPANPLFARVLVNRIWLGHFGRGIVATPNDFGTRGLAPTHPELLDWLASDFKASGWSIKAMHRKIMLSATWRQSAGDPTAPQQMLAAALDPNNELYWRHDRQRLSCEELRDSLLIAGGKLDRTPGRAHPIPPTSTWTYTQHVPFSGVAETEQRSVYLLTLRNRRHPFLGLFDGADPNATTPQRQVTTVPTQSLYFMNDPFFHAQAERVASRSLVEVDDQQRLNKLFQIAFQRAPLDGERTFAFAFLDQYRNVLPNATLAASVIATGDGSDAAEGTAAGENRVSKAVVSGGPSDELVVWSALARVLLSSNEFIVLD